MSPTSATLGELVVATGALQDLYDRHRYLDAYAITAGYWATITDPQVLSLDDLILAGRLAARLGGPRRSRWLFRAAAKRDRADPRVRYFTQGLRSSGWRLLDVLRAFEREPDVGGDDPRLRAAWYASYALTWAGLRDFERAYECLDRGRALAPDDPWSLSCESNVHGLADRWADALRSAERAWEIDPGSPFAGYSLGNSLLNLGRVVESAARLYAAAEGSQSFELTGDACWRQCALAETLEGQEREGALRKARCLVDRLPSLSPLADRESKAMVARTRLDIAALSDDDAEIERWADEVRSPFHRQILANLRRNADGRRIRLPFRPAVQKYEACVPASVAIAMSARGHVVSADEMASEITFGGTPEWAAADWLRSRGFHVRMFAVTRDTAVRLIRHGIAFVLCWDAEEAGHAVAVVGMDERAETLLVHDPQSFRSTEYLLPILDARASPLGIKGMVAVANAEAAELDALLPPEAEVMEAAQKHQRALARQGPSGARAIVEDLARRFPSHPGTRHLQAVQALADGQVGQALKQLQELLREFPDAPIVRVRLLGACRALGNTGRLRQVLRDIVERGVLPGLQAQQDWIRPPERYVFEYADILRLSSATRDQAEALLHSLLRRQPSSSGAWHVLADLLWHRSDVEGVLLCNRLASLLAPSDEHYAGAYAAILAVQKREEEGFGWLEKRVRTLGASPHAVGTWVTWIGTLEDRGYPERALAACREALERHPRSVELLTFAVPFFARMGLWEVAEEQLLALKSCGHAAAHHEAAAHYFQMRAALDSAVDHCEAWIDESPHDVQARRSMLRLLETRDGPDAALERAAQWMQANRDHEAFEEAYCAQLDRASRASWKKKCSVLLRRLERNREDGWAWCELTFDCLQHYDAADDRRRRRLGRRIERLLDECDRTCGESLSALRAHALWSEERGDWEEAVARSLECIDRDPGGFYSYQRAWHCSARFSDAERRRVWSQMSASLLNLPGRLSIAREMMALLAERFGLAEAEKEVERWRAERPDDPDALEAAVDLLIEHGHGVSDAERALAMLEPAVERYPFHPGLRFSLANAYHNAGEHAEAEKVLREIVRRHPDNSAARVQLAWVKQRSGNAEGAHEILDAALASDPQNPYVLAARVRILLENKRSEAALEMIRDGLTRMPNSVQWRDWAVALLMRCGARDQAVAHPAAEGSPDAVLPREPNAQVVMHDAARDEAVAAARQGVLIYPRGAFLWLLLGRTLDEMRRYARTGEIESCFRRSLALNASLFEAADRLARWLADRERHDEAAQVMRDIEPRMADPSPARGRLACIERGQGLKDEAVAHMTTAVTAAPWFGWGWGVLCEWLDEDQNWVEARRLLREVPPQMFTDVAFRWRRLVLLGKAGLDRDELEAEWDRLLRDFPDDESLKAARAEWLNPPPEPASEAAVPTPEPGVPRWVVWAVIWAAVNVVAGIQSCH